MGIKHVSRFHSLPKDMLINLLETLSPTFTFEYKNDNLIVYLKESSAKFKIFSVSIYAFDQFTRLALLVDIISSGVDFKTPHTGLAASFYQALKEGDSFSRRRGYFYEEEEDYWMAGVHTSVSDNHLGICYLGQELHLYVRRMMSTSDRAEFLIPLDRCDRQSLVKSLNEMSAEFKKRASSSSSSSSSWSCCTCDHCTSYE